MNFFIALAGIALLLVLIWYVPRQLKRSKRARIRSAALPEQYQQILQANVGLYSQLPDDLKAELQGLVNVFLDEKTFIGCDGLAVTDEMRVTVAGLACVLLLNRETTLYAGFSSVMMYPTAYIATEVSYDGSVEVRKQVTRAGESWHRGPVVLSWADTLHGAANVRDGYNVVLHEFAHKLDEENNGTNGMPVLHEQAHYGEWAKVLGKEYESLEARAARGKNKVLHAYGLTSPPEFFAVATESFFEKSAAMKMKLPKLYEQLRLFYRLDPVEWDD